MTTETKSASPQITDEVTSWPGVEAGPGSRGEFAFTVGGQEIGHLHGDHAAHFGFPRDVGARLRAEGRVGPHPVNRHSTKMVARRIETEADVRDVIELMRLNYDRVAPVRAPAAEIAYMETGIPGLHASTPGTLPFAPKLQIRAFLLERELGNLLVYSASTLDSDTEAIRQLGGVARHYLGHHHEAMFTPSRVSAPLFVHEADRAPVAERAAVRATFSQRHTLDDDFEVIPIPGHTPGATAFLWRTGEHRLLFTGDSLFLDGDEWRAAVLDSSDRAAYVESLELMRELDFDVLVPWAATRGGPYLAATTRGDAGRRIDAVLERVRGGGDR